MDKAYYLWVSMKNLRKSMAKQINPVLENVYHTYLRILSSAVWRVGSCIKIFLAVEMQTKLAILRTVMTFEY